MVNNLGTRVSSYSEISKKIIIIKDRGFTLWNVFTRRDDDNLNVYRLGLKVSYSHTFIVS